MRSKIKQNHIDTLLCDERWLATHHCTPWGIALRTTAHCTGVCTVVCDEFNRATYFRNVDYDRLSVLMCDSFLMLSFTSDPNLSFKLLVSKHPASSPNRNFYNHIVTRSCLVFPLNFGTQFYMPYSVRYQSTRLIKLMQRSGCHMGKLRVRVYPWVGSGSRNVRPTDS